MKHILISLIFFCVNYSFTQERDHLNELIFQAEGLEPTFDIAFIVQPVADQVQYTRTPLPTNKWKIVSNASSQYLGFEGNYLGYDYGLDAIFSDDSPYGNTFWITLNKIIVKDVIADTILFYFYLNYFHSELGALGNSAIDVTLRYYRSEYNSGMYFKSGLWMEPTTSQMTQINLGETLTIWEIKGYSNNTSTFELWTTISTQNNHPYLTWNPYNNIDFTATHYEVWRGLSPDGTNPPATFNLIATVGVATLSYLDNQLSIGGSSKYFYKIRAKNGGVNSLFGNKVSTNAMISEKEFSSTSNSIMQFSIFQNYPKPLQSKYNNNISNTRRWIGNIKGSRCIWKRDYNSF